MRRIAPLVLLAACEPAPEAVDCTDAEVPSVVLTLEDADGTPVTDAWIGYEVGQESGVCEALGDGTFACGFETAGELRIEVRADGRRELTDAITVEPGECHVQTVERTLTLERLGAFFPQDRAYLHRFIEDDDECERSWELYGMNCYAWAIFCADGDVEIVWTDIVDLGIYGLLDDAVIHTETSGDDVPADLAFDIVSETEIVDREWGASWTLDATGEWTSPYCD